MWYHLQIQRRQISALSQCRNLNLLGLADDLPVRAHDAPDRGIRDHLLVVGLGRRASVPVG